MNELKFIAIIPARYASSRFPGKPLVELHGKPLIRHVYENTRKIIQDVWVATDDQRIYETVCSFGGQGIITSSHHTSGTDRVAEAAERISGDLDFDGVLNIQGDELFVGVEQIHPLMQCFTPDTEIATLVRPVRSEEELFDPNRPKVVVGNNNKALYFSRAPIPWVRDEEKDQWLHKTPFWAHVGIYAYRKDILRKIADLKPGTLEKAESLEQLRWLENGFSINIALTHSSGFGIDTPEDLLFALQKLDQGLPKSVKRS